MRLAYTGTAVNHGSNDANANTIDTTFLYHINSINKEKQLIMIDVTING